MYEIPSWASYSSLIGTFLYLHCSDLEPARRFYSDVLGLTEVFFSAEEGLIGYQAGELQITIATHVDPVHVDGWAKQLGWEGGSSPMPSWGVEYLPDEFRRAVEAARAAEVSALHPEPLWVGYWSFPVKDPMGYTVEISARHADAWPPAD